MIEVPDDLDVRLAELLANGPLPGRAPQEKFAPSLCYGRHFGYAAHDVRPAAVVMALYRMRQRWYLPLTRRPTSLRAHGGQICLPGGAIDPGETPEEAAVRELEEELAVSAADVTLLGQFPSLNLFVSNFWVTPFVAVLPDQPSFTPSPEEVAELIEAPVSSIVDSENHFLKIRRLGMDESSWSYDAPYIEVKRQQVWGATAVILGGLIGAIRQMTTA